MSSLFSFFQRLFGATVSPQEDHLGGPIDLSDAVYCLGLLAPESD